MSMEAIINTLNLILLIVVILVFWRLKSVLGTHDDFTKRGRPPSESKPLSGDPSPADTQTPPNLRVVSSKEDDAHMSNLAALTKIDRNFDLPAFLDEFVVIEFVKTLSSSWWFKKCWFCG